MLICFNNVTSPACAKNFSLVGAADPEAIQHFCLIFKKLCYESHAISISVT
jgi:hypothetical protein